MISFRCYGASGLLYCRTGLGSCDKHDPGPPLSLKMAINMRTPDTANLISTCENALVILQICCSASIQISVARWVPPMTLRTYSRHSQSSLDRWEGQGIIRDRSTVSAMQVSPMWSHNKPAQHYPKGPAMVRMLCRVCISCAARSRVAQRCTSGSCDALLMRGRIDFSACVSTTNNFLVVTDSVDGLKWG